MEVVKPYKKSFDYSYTLGAFPTFELLKARPEQVRAVYVHSTFTDRQALAQLCGALGISLAQFFTDAEHESFYPLTQEQAALVEKWGKLKAEQKKAILTIMDGLM